MLPVIAKLIDRVARPEQRGDVHHDAIALDRRRLLSIVAFGVNRGPWSQPGWSRSRSCCRRTLSCSVPSSTASIGSCSRRRNRAELDRDSRRGGAGSQARARYRIAVS